MMKYATYILKLLFMLEFRSLYNELFIIQDCEVVGPDGVEDSVSRALRGEMETRLAQLEARVRHLRTESDEVWKTLETAETTLLQMVHKLSP